MEEILQIINQLWTEIQSIPIEEIVDFIVDKAKDFWGEVTPWWLIREVWVLFKDCLSKSKSPKQTGSSGTNLKLDSIKRQMDAIREQEEFTDQEEKGSL